jgi:hypothetical protein
VKIVDKTSRLAVHVVRAVVHTQIMRTRRKDSRQQNFKEILIYRPRGKRIVGCPEEWVD